jgi:hypothetical protein
LLSGNQTCAQTASTQTQYRTRVGASPWRRRPAAAARHVPLEESKSSLQRRQLKGYAPPGDRLALHRDDPRQRRLPCEPGSRRVIVAPRLGEGDSVAADGAIHPETLRQKDRSCNELWRAAHAVGGAPTDGARAAANEGSRPTISQVHGQGGELVSGSPLFCFLNPLQQVLLMD